MPTLPRTHRVLVAALAGCGAGDFAQGDPALPSVDLAEPVVGVPDGDNDPAVVAIDVGGSSLCAGVLLAADVVLTAWHCAAVSAASFQCPRAAALTGDPAPALVSPSSLRVLVGADVASAVERARARAIVVPGGLDPCANDVAVLLLDQSIDDVESVSVGPAGAAQGAHIRTVGFQPGGPDGVVTRFVREHVPVVATSTAQFDADESPCAAGCGGPALDETTGEVVGVASRWVSGNGGAVAFDMYTGAAAFLGLVGSALAQSTAAPVSAARAALQKATKGPTDMGASCDRGSDCAAGACVTDGDQRYCTRGCSAADACPTHFRCEKTAQGPEVCVAS